MHHNDPNKPYTTSHKRHSLNFDKIDNFLKSNWNMFSRELRWGERVINEGIGILHQIYGFSGGVNIWGSRIHYSKSWYYLGLSQASKVNFFAETVFSRNCCNFVFKNLPLRCLTGSIRRFEKTLLCFISEDCASSKKYVIATPQYAWVYFSKRRCDWLYCGWAGRRVVIKRGRWHI